VLFDLEGEKQFRLACGDRAMSLRTRLLLFVALATLVPTILLGIRFSQDRAKEIDLALTTLAVRAGNIANDLDEKVQGTAQLHFGLERARDLDNLNRPGFPGGHLV
jgi:hypothetical protein